MKFAGIRASAAGALLALWSSVAAAHEVVHFLSLDPSAPALDGYLFQPASGGRHPALIFLHGCGGLINRSGQINARETDWAARFNAMDYVVLMVDSLSPRHHGEMCSVSGFDQQLYRQRPRDAYGALAWLQAQDFVAPDRVGMIGWSEGGGVILFSIGVPSLGRPADLPPERDFRAAVAFYPASCRDNRQPASWTTGIPLLVLVGDGDVWTPLPPCQTFLGAAAARGAVVTLQAYTGAVHDFDWPNLKRSDRPEYTTAAGVVPVTGMDPAARAEALQRVPAFLAGYLGR